MVVKSSLALVLGEATKSIIMQVFMIIAVATHTKPGATIILPGYLVPVFTPEEIKMRRSSAWFVFK